ncbi:binding-protein-dependent transport systems inner membrane component [Caldicellulosiruptor acetigenus I77R1B]|uniref:Binding-protein-dependent transport systems inner membrane component n=1 Tax=Caldicellulosiruptor acetigenus (strain ATCC 700853 / DSM 12137 / I77R1B) TaxID=632335 RepID=E4S6R0_CALA7|nr:ABC transporter permease [Caldicellulosiruptor acetigenus]ADQ40675.1 binding-protein-dependent transport systems inner membrane component [Caldicellulosiruptor acetigenus I77R1B]
MVYKIFVELFKIWKPYVFPSPISVIETFVRLLSDNTLTVAMIATVRRMLIGYLIAAILGVVVGLAIVKSEFLDKNLRPLILGFQTLPSVCWLPFAILWYGLSEKAIIFVTAIGSIFSITLAVESGIKNVNPLYIKAAKTMGATGLRLYLNVIFPASLPFVISGMKQGWSFAFRALMAGEMLFATKGLGQVLMVGRDLADMSQVISVMIVTIVFGLVIEKAIFGPLENQIRIRWGLKNT